MSPRFRPTPHWIACGVLLGGCGTLLGIDDLNFDVSNQGAGGQGGDETSVGGAQGSMSSGAGGQCESIANLPCSTADDCHNDCANEVFVCDRGRCQDRLNCGVALAADEAIVDVVLSPDFVQVLVLGTSGTQDELRLKRYRRDNCAHDNMDDRSAPLTFAGTVDRSTFRASMDLADNNVIYVAWQANVELTEQFGQNGQNLSPHDCHLASWEVNDPGQMPRVASMGAPCVAGTLTGLGATGVAGPTLAFVGAQSVLDSEARPIIHRFFGSGEELSHDQSLALSEGTIADLARISSPQGHLLVVGHAVSCETLDGAYLTPQQVRDGAMDPLGSPLGLPAGGCTFKIARAFDEYNGDAFDAATGDQLSATQSPQAVQIDSREGTEERSAVLTHAIGRAQIMSVRNGGIQDFGLFLESETLANVITSTSDTTFIGGATRGPVSATNEALVVGTNFQQPFLVGLNTDGVVEWLLSLPTTGGDGSAEPILVALDAEEVSPADPSVEVVVSGRTGGSTISYGETVVESGRDFFLIYQFGSN